MNPMEKAKAMENRRLPIAVVSNGSDVERRSSHPIAKTLAFKARRMLSAVAFLAIAAGVSIHCYRSATPGIDAMGYAGIVALADTGSVVRAHEMVYSDPLTPHLRGLDENTPQALDMRRRAADP